MQLDTPGVWNRTLWDRRGFLWQLLNQFLDLKVSLDSHGKFDFCTLHDLSTGHFRTRAGFWPVPHIHALGMNSWMSQSGLACSGTPRVSETGHFGTRAGFLIPALPNFILKVFRDDHGKFDFSRLHVPSTGHFRIFLDKSVLLGCAAYPNTRNGSRSVFMWVSMQSETTEVIETWHFGTRAGSLTLIKPTR